MPGEQRVSERQTRRSETSNLDPAFSSSPNASAPDSKRRSSRRCSTSTPCRTRSPGRSFDRWAPTSSRRRRVATNDSATWRGRTTRCGAVCSSRAGGTRAGGWTGRGASRSSRGRRRSTRTGGGVSFAGWSTGCTRSTRLAWRCEGTWGARGRPITTSRYSACRRARGVRRCRAWGCCGSARSGGAWATGSR